VQRTFAVTAFFVHSWSIRGFLHELPSFINYFSTAPIMAILAYMMATALVESALVTIVLVGIGTVLPRKWFSEAFARSSFITTLVGAIAMLKLEDALLVDTRSLPACSFYLTWAMVSIGSLIILLVLVYKVRPLHDGIQFLVERISLLGYLYIFIGLVAFVVVVIRIIG
jgi:hypothetical protein